MTQYEMGDLGTGRTLDIAGSLLRNHLKDLLRINLYIFIPAYLVVNLLILLLSPEATPSGAIQNILNQIENPETAVPTGTEMAMKVTGLLLAGLYGVVDLLFIGPITSAALIYYIACRYLGRETTPRECLSRAFKKYGAFLLVGVLYWLILLAVKMVGILGAVIFVLLSSLGASITPAIPIVVGGVVGLLVLWGFLYFSVRYALSFTVVMVEDIHDAAALRRSSFLTRDRSWRGIWLYLLGYCVIGLLVVGGMAVVPVGWLSVVLVTIGTALTQTFALAVLVSYYFNCRCLHENFDITYLSRNAFPVEAAVLPPSPAEGYRSGEALVQGEAPVMADVSAAALADDAQSAADEAEPEAASGPDAGAMMAEPAVSDVSSEGSVPPVSRDGDAAHG